MRSASRILLPVAAAAILASASACRSASPWTVDPQRPDDVQLVVQNNNFADMDVWVVGDGLPTRVGTVTGNSSATFALDPSLYAAPDLRVIGTPIGGNGRASSGPLVVSRGQTVTFTIGPQLRLSNAVVR